MAQLYRKSALDRISSPEQLDKARTLIMERGRERGRMRQGMGPGGERPTPPPDGSAPRDKPFEAAK